MSAVKFECPHCHQHFELPEAEYEGMIMCPQCKQEFEVVVEKPEPAPPPRKKPGLIVTTGGDVAGMKIVEYLGGVRGITVRSPTGGQDFMGGLQKMFGGTLEAYIKMCDQVRQEAYAKMKQEALMLNADAIIAFRYDATELAANVTEVLAYGTAVKLAD